MEISEAELARMTQEVGDLHREGMETMASDIAELHAGEGRRIMGHSRRTFVKGAGMGGVALAIGSAAVPLSSLWSSAYAATSSDVAIAKFAASVELAAVAAYAAAAKTGKVTGQGLKTAEAFAMQHQDHANAFSGFAGDTATAVANPKLVAAIGGEITMAASATAIVKIAYSLENAAAATYLYAIGALTETAALALTATILPIESQHATIWGTTLGMSLNEIIPPFLKTTGYVNPAAYPITPGT
jgi:Ferritin-like domain